MEEKFVLMDVEGTFSRDDAVAMLKKLVDELAQGKLTTPDGEAEVGGQIKMVCKGKYKHKGEGSKGQVTLELSWFVPDTLRIG